MNFLKSFYDRIAAAIAQQEQAAAEFSRHFTPRAREAFAFAEDEAFRLNHNFIGTEHVLLGLLKLNQGVAVQLLRWKGVDLNKLRTTVEEYVPRGADIKIQRPFPFTPRVKKVLVIADKEARALNHAYVGTEHILLGLLAEGDGVAARVLERFGLRMPQTREEILTILDPNLDQGEQPPHPDSPPK